MRSSSARMPRHSDENNSLTTRPSSASDVGSVDRSGSMHGYALAPAPWHPARSDAHSRGSTALRTFTCDHASGCARARLSAAAHMRGAATASLSPSDPSTAGANVPICRADSAGDTRTTADTSSYVAERMLGSLDVTSFHTRLSSASVIAPRATRRCASSAASAVSASGVGDAALLPARAAERAPGRRPLRPAPPTTVGDASAATSPAATATSVVSVARPFRLDTTALSHASSAYTAAQGGATRRAGASVCATLQCSEVAKRLTSARFITRRSNRVFGFWATIARRSRAIAGA